MLFKKNKLTQIKSVAREEKFDIGDSQATKKSVSNLEHIDKDELKKQVDQLKKQQAEEGRLTFKSTGESSQLERALSKPLDLSESEEDLLTQMLKSGASDQEIKEEFPELFN